MPRDPSGTYTAPSNSWNPAVDATTIDPADWNAILLDMVAQGLNVLPASLLDGDLLIANFNSGTGASAATAWFGDGTWKSPVMGPNSASDNAAARFDSTTGKLIQNSALIISDTTGALSRAGNGGIPLQGTNTNDSAAAGDVGEYIESVLASGSATALTTTIAKTVTSISLTAGDWDVDSVAYFTTAASTSVTQMMVSVSGTTDTVNTTPGRLSVSTIPAVVPTAGTALSSALPPYRLSLSGTTTIYMVVQATFTAAALTAFGIIRARRVR